ncbi:MAG: redoxin domain-containing protein [bacterium]|nr:redoxin domain-containing protein [bacterium]
MRTTLVGHPAPQFALPTSEGRVLSLESLRGSVVILAFFRGTW